jgi:hypothetical protein
MNDLNSLLANTKMRRFILLSLVLVLLAGLINNPRSGLDTLAADSNNQTRRVNVPYAQVKPPDPYPTQMAIFWFGQVDPTNNYADVRTIYDDDNLTVVVHIFDRQLWYDANPTKENLTDWDAVSLFLSPDGNVEDAPGVNAHRFVAQVNHSQPRQNYQAAYQGNGSGWQPATTAFETTTGWRGGAFNDNQQSSRGWFARFSIPFSSLGFTHPPSKGTTWGLALVVHDRDDLAGTSIPDAVWPENMNSNIPSTWGQLVFGLPVHSPGDLLPWGSTTLRHGLEGVTVMDAHVGGHTTCGADHWPDFFNAWGDANYAGYTEINIQNQWDVADWPCFSKFYLTFPLDSLPDDKTFHSASLTLHQFGSAWGAEVEPSFIQVLTVAEDWDEATLTWNNAPLALENISGTWVEPIGFPGWPGIPRRWDVSRAVAQALAAGEPLRLALYSADGAYHSGRYFSSSDTGDWNAEARPTLKVVWGVPRDSGEFYFIFLPALTRH